jgi:hypothetical protein
MIDARTPSSQQYASRLQSSSGSIKASQNRHYPGGGGLQEVWQRPQSGPGGGHGANP